MLGHRHAGVVVMRCAGSSGAPYTRRPANTAHDDVLPPNAIACRTKVRTRRVKHAEWAAMLGYFDNRPRYWTPDPDAFGSQACAISSYGLIDSTYARLLTVRTVPCA